MRRILTGLLVVGLVVLGGCASDQSGQSESSDTSFAALKAEYDEAIKQANETWKGQAEAVKAKGQTMLQDAQRDLKNAKTDIEKAAATAPYAVFDNAGQDCCARSRILVAASVLDKFMALLEPAVQGVRVGDPTAADTEMGPLISAAHRAHVASYVHADAPVAFRGSAPQGPGYWYPPTVLAPVAADSPAYTEEIFGPVVTVTPFTGEDEAISMANDSPYGLSGSIWTSNVGRAIRVARGVETGNLSVNSHSSVRYWTPFGGFKQSGLGRELGPDAVDAFTEIKNVFIATE